MGWGDEGEGCDWVSSGDGSTILDDEADVHELVGFVLSDGDDPLKLVDEVGESKDGSEGDDGAQKSKEEDVFEVSLEILLFKVVASSEDHRGQ